MNPHRDIPIPAETFAKSKVGDVIRVTGNTVPKALWKCWFRVESKTDNPPNVTLSIPYVDQALTQPFSWSGSQRGSALALERRSRSHRAA